MVIFATRKTENLPFQPHEALGPNPFLGPAYSETIKNELNALRPNFCSDKMAENLAKKVPEGGLDKFLGEMKSLVLVIGQKTTDDSALISLGNLLSDSNFKPEYLATVMRINKDKTGKEVSWNIDAIANLISNSNFKPECFEMAEQLTKNAGKDETYHVFHALSAFISDNGSSTENLKLFEKAFDWAINKTNEKDSFLCVRSAVSLISAHEFKPEHLDLFVKIADLIIRNTQGGDTGETQWALINLSGTLSEPKFNPDYLEPMAAILKGRGRAETSGILKAVSTMFSHPGFEPEKHRFFENPMSISLILNQSGKEAVFAMASFFDPRISEDIRNNYLADPLKNIQLLMPRIVAYGVATDLGEPIDSLHDDGQNRKKYVDSLNLSQVLGLLMSDPNLFYTSSNNMLFDRLNKLLGENGASLSQFLQENQLIDTNPDLVRNLFFRAMNYGRLHGGPDSILDGAGFKQLVPLIFEPIKSGKFDANYFYLLGNGLEAIKSLGLAKDLLKAIGETASGDQKFNRAREFVRKYLEGTLEDSSKAFYNPSLFCSKDGKQVLVQVFDKEDSGNGEGGNFKEAMRDAQLLCGKPKKGEYGELIYENGNRRIILICQEEGTNRQFLENRLKTDSNMILTFRGHSYSLNDNIPPEIFGNVDANILFVMGSCGSSGAVPNYMEKNPKINFSFVSNESTGRAAVTQRGLIPALLDQKSSGKKYADVLKSREKEIKAGRGDLETIKTYDDGQWLLDYVLRNAPSTLASQL